MDRTRYVRRTDLADIDERARCQRAMDIGSGRNLRSAADNICTRNDRSRAASSWPLHHGSILVYGFNFFREPCSDDRAFAFQYICWDRAWRRTGIYLGTNHGYRTGAANRAVDFQALRETRVFTSILRIELEP